MTTLKIKVTKEILAKSKMCGHIPNQLNSEHCAIALSVRDIFPKAGVSREHIFTNTADLRNKIPLPRKASAFIADFDKASPKDRCLLPELEFEISIPDEIVEQINFDELRPLLQNHPTLELI